MKINMTVNRLLFVIVVSALFVLTGCHWGDGWLDDGYTYLCPECRGALVYMMLGECEHCGEYNTSCSYKYCYSCAKYLDCCQMCGIER